MIFVFNTNEKRKDAKVVKTKMTLVIKKGNVIHLQGHFIVAIPLKNTNFCAVTSKQNFSKKWKKEQCQKARCILCLDYCLVMTKYIIQWSLPKYYYIERMQKFSRYFLCLSCIYSLVSQQGKTYGRS